MKRLPNSSLSSRQLELQAYPFKELTYVHRDVLVERKQLCKEEQLEFDFSFAQGMTESVRGRQSTASQRHIKNDQSDNSVDSD